MKSGLEGRNNRVDVLSKKYDDLRVSMKSGLEGRNNVDFRLDKLERNKPSQ